MGRHNHTSPQSPESPRKVVRIVAVEDDEEEEEDHTTTAEDLIPGPPMPTIEETTKQQTVPKRQNLISRVLNTSGSSRGNQNHNHNSASAINNSRGSSSSTSSQIVGQRGPNGIGKSPSMDELQLSLTEHHWSGGGILASRADLLLPPAEFAKGCNLLQACASGNLAQVQALLAAGANVQFRDYDRRTALHVAASEGHLAVCQYLVQQGAHVNRSDRWGGSPLDDAHRHRHLEVIAYLRQQGGTTGSGNRTTNLIVAAADGDVDEVKTLLQQGQLVKGAAGTETIGFDVNKGDYDKRTPLHLAAGEGHLQVVQVLLDAGADPNVEDRWQRRPLDDAHSFHHDDVIRLLKEHGAARGTRRLDASQSDHMDNSARRISESMKIDFEELEMIDRIGAGAFGEIYKCRWRGTLVAAKIIKSAKIQKEWAKKRVAEALKSGKDVDDVIRQMDQDDEENVQGAEEEKEMAMLDFRREISVLKSLRHPHIVLMLAYSTNENYECIISELMKCSLLDVFKAHILQGTQISKRTQIVYATQLALGMNYLHTCKPPIIHRDLKPANLLIDHSGVLKISDFGLSKVRRDPGRSEKEAFTMTGETGSYRFMAPEVYKHEDYNETVDVYSYAMILFYLLVGRPPWPDLSGLRAVQKAAVEGDRPSIPRELDMRMATLLKECWNDHAAARPPFSKIATICSAYNRDVFHQDTNSIPAPISPEVDSECQCCRTS